MKKMTGSLNISDVASLTISRLAFMETPTNKSVEVIEHALKDYFTSTIKQAVDTGEAIEMPNLGFMQVVEVVSKKGYAWDKVYNGKDYVLILKTDIEAMIFEIDDKWYQRILKKALTGVVYRPTPVLFKNRMSEILNLLNADKK
jgi:hypothetical protein